MAVELVAPEPESIELRPPRRFDLRALWRLSAWGGAAAVALVAVAVATQTETGSRRLAAIEAASLDLPVRSVATVQIPKQDAQVAKLQAQMRTLAADRDRLAERVAGLEQNIEDLTGSVKRQAAQISQPTGPPILSMVPGPSTSPRSANAPMASPPATVAAKSPDSPAQTADAPAPEAAPPSAPEQTAEPGHDAVPMPPVRVASSPPEPTKPEFGVALASASSLDVLHLQWAALKANYGPLLGGLRPIASREQRGTATYYRLVLGPLPNLANATKLCARLTAARAPCHAGKFAGDPL